MTSSYDAVGAMTSGTPSFACLLLALALDAALGEPPATFHPVVWLGGMVGALRRFAPRCPAPAFTFGLLLVVLCVALAAALGLGVSSLRPGWPCAAFIAEVFLLKSALAVRALGHAARLPRDALLRGDVVAARRALANLCSRDARRLDGPALMGATVASLGENASDSIVGPLVYYVLLGLPGALAYRAVNTLDAMIGYRGETEWLGKVAARLDDVMNLVPARLTAGLLLASGALLRHDVTGGIATLIRDGGTTQSPNAGRPMAALAGLLGVRLEKTGQYVLDGGHRPLTPEVVTEAWRVVLVAALLSAVLALGVLRLTHGT